MEGDTRLNNDDDGEDDDGDDDDDNGNDDDDFDDEDDDDDPHSAASASVSLSRARKCVSSPPERAVMQRLLSGTCTKYEKQEYCKSERDSDKKSELLIVN